MLSECDSADSGGSGVVAWDRSSALNKPCFGASGHAELSMRSHCGVGEQGEVGWSLSVGSPVEKVSAGGPQPALPFFCHFPVCLPLVLVPPLLPPEEAELGGRAVKHGEIRQQVII